MIRHQQAETSAIDFLPVERDLESLRQAARACQGCDLCRHATQTVFGAGPVDARLVFVGDQPDAAEDRQGEPFVGPVGKVFDAVLADVGIDRSRVYLTHVVKHFKSTLRGRERLAAKVSAGEIRACFPWLEAELAAIRPEIIVCLGAVAAHALLGSAFRVSRQHGEWVSTCWASRTMATYHPSAILQSPDALRADVQQALVEDLTRVAAAARTASSRGEEQSSVSGTGGFSTPIPSPSPT